jgi:hypothetical protein
MHDGSHVVVLPILIPPHTLFDMLCRVQFLVKVKCWRSKCSETPPRMLWRRLPTRQSLGHLKLMHSHAYLLKELSPDAAAHRRVGRGGGVLICTESPLGMRKLTITKQNKPTEPNMVDVCMCLAYTWNAPPFASCCRVKAGSW